MSYHGKIYWNELNTWKPHEAMAFYKEIMGWSFEQAQTAGTKDGRAYYLAKTSDGTLVAGIFQLIEPDFVGVPDHWFTYIAVDDLDAAVATATANGGKLSRQPFNIAGFGRMAVVQDAVGAYMAWIEPDLENSAVS